MLEIFWEESWAVWVVVVVVVESKAANKEAEVEVYWEDWAVAAKKEVVASWASSEVSSECQDLVTYS